MSILPVLDRLTFRTGAATLTLTLVLASAGCANDGAMRRSGSRPGGAGAAAQPHVAEVLTSLDEETLAFHQHVVALSDPFFEGRAPGSEGIERAAAYLETHLRAIGLEPAFPPEGETPGGAEAARSHRQTFEVQGDTVVRAAEASYETGRGPVLLTIGEDFNPMGASANAYASGPIAFVGYAVEEGEDGYTSFPSDDDLTGKIALVLRFEPMDGRGESLWAQDGWSGAAGIQGKIAAPIERGAAGVVFVNAPGADDPRADRLLTTEATTFGEPFDVPVVAMSADAANALVREADPRGRSLLDLRRLADAGDAGVIDLTGATLSLNIDLERRRVPTQNIAGVLPGNGRLADEWVVVGAHYDHLGDGPDGSRTPAREGEIHNGADDNASGTAGVLLAARRLRERYDAMPDRAEARSVLFLLFSAEEMGLLGARHFVEDASVPMDQVVAMINMDMIGRVRAGDLEVSGVDTGEGMRKWLEPRFEASGFDISASGGGAGPSDHAAFYRAGVPVLHLFSGLHEEYHTPDDDFHLINIEDGARVAAFAADLAHDFATRPERFAHHEAAPETTTTRAAARVRLGVVPGSYDETERGLLIGDVVAGGPAAEAGLRKGDRVVAWNGEELANVFSYMQALSGHEPGDIVRLGVERDGETIEVEVALIPWEGDS